MERRLPVQSPRNGKAFAFADGVRRRRDARLLDERPRRTELTGVAEKAAEAERPSPRPIDDAMFRLLPDMSEDPAQAQALREMTSPSLSVAKAEHLFLLWRSVNG